MESSATDPGSPSKIQPIPDATDATATANGPSTEEARTSSHVTSRKKHASGKLSNVVDGEPRDGSMKRTVSMKDVGVAIGERSRIRRYNFWLKFYACVVSIVWNVASPIKSYLLSFYGLPGDDLVFSHNVNWTMEIDYAYARKLYDLSGVNYTAPEDKPIRFINMYLDFVVFNRAKIWAKHLDNFQQDPYVGLFCRTSLVPKGEKILEKQRDDCGVDGTAGRYAGHSYLEQQTCRVSEVSEAVMCLKGIDVLTLMNYEWKSSYDPNNTYVQQGARIYQDLVFPDLDACLARRALLVERYGRDDALQMVTEELAANYSLDPTGFAGRKGLYQEVRFFDGFKDLSGKPSGVRYSKMSGSLPQRTQPIEPDLNALVLGRERLWWLVGLTPAAFVTAVADFSYYAPYLFVGMHMQNKAMTGRFVELYSMEKAGTTGVCQNWALKPTSFKQYPTPVYIEDEPTSSTLTAYGGRIFQQRVIDDNALTNATEVGRVRSRMSTICFARDNCTDLCTETMAAGWLTTFDRSGLCQKRAVSQSTLNRQGYVDTRCLGEGLGSDVLSIKILENVTRSDNSTFQYHRVKNITNPGAIVACVLGGRIPQAGDEPYPNVFFDLLEAGANTIITTTFSRGTEKVLVNVYALVSLVGCAVFSFWVMQNMMRLIRMVRVVKARGLTDSLGLSQLLDSVFTVNLSTVAHGRNIQLSKVILWLNLVTWYIGAADSNCTWWVDGQDLWGEGVTLKSSDSPYYECKPGVFVDHLNSLLGVVRLFSISYNFYSLTCQHLILRGATRYARPFLSPILIFGVLPTFLGSLVITGINHLRLNNGVLNDLHNQLFLVLLWIAYLFGYHALLQNKTVGRLYVDLLCKCKLCGKQKLRIGSTAEALVGPYYLTLPEFVINEEVEWVPLSVALECPTFEIAKLDFAARKYSLTTRVKGEIIKAPPVPQWVLDDDEFFFC